MSTSILRLPAVKSRTGLSRSTIYQRVADGDFPRPVSLGPRAVGWLAHEVDAWIEDRVAARSATGSRRVPVNDQESPTIVRRSGSSGVGNPVRAHRHEGE